VPNDETDGALLRAWTLWLEDPTDDGDREAEALIPVLVAAGYAEVEGTFGALRRWE
jgi:hypothetical protein